MTTPEIYLEAVRDVKMFLEGRPTDLSRSLRERMAKAAEAEEYERAAKYRDLISTVEQLQEKQRIASVEGDDADVFGYHFENDMLAVNLFHMRGGRVLDRREFFWEELPEIESAHVAADALARTEQSSPEFHPGEFFSALLTQLYIGQPYVPRNIYVPVDFEDREELEDLLSEQLAGEGGRATRVHIDVPQRGDKRSLIDLAGNNAKQSYDQRFRVMKPNQRQIQEALQDATGTAGAASPHRVLRYFSHSRRGDGCIDGRLGRRPDEESPTIANSLFARSMASMTSLPCAKW